MKLSVTAETKTGIKIYLRPVEGSDKTLVQKFLTTLSVESIYRRFFTSRKSKVNEFWQKFFVFNLNQEMKILVVIDKNLKEEVVGVGQLHICSDTSLAEVALVVSDCYQNTGIGRELLSYMMQLAQKRGLEGLEGIVQLDNWPILHICKTMGWGTYVKTARAGAYELKMYFD